LCLGLFSAYSPQTVVVSESEGETAMSHYPGHLRAQFVDWVESGCPDEAIVEENYEERKVPADEMLRAFLTPGCSDVIPGSTCADIADGVGYTRDARGMSYALGASVLLVQRAAGDDAAERYFARVLGTDDE